MDLKEFNENGHKLIDWITEYLQTLESYPVKSPLQPGEVKKALPIHPPERPEEWESQMSDFEKIILPGMTHWQHPRFFAYFPANNSYPSILGELLTAAMGAQCMSWQTSPAATELEERVMEWLRELIGLPETFTGVIEETATSSTLCAILSARERATSFLSNEEGLQASHRLRVYCSQEAHSSIEKDVKIAGIGRKNLCKIPVDSAYAMIPEELEKAVQRDLAAGLHPMAVIAALGTTGSTALDPLVPLGRICKEHNLWFHVDGAYAGSALLLPEMRHIAAGIEEADSFVFNPHKWLFTNFDISAYFVKDVSTLIRTFEILPEYLKTAEGDRVINYRDWGIALGRRFRALKLWMVLRTYGAEGLRKTLRNHIRWAAWLRERVEKAPDFELMAPAPLSTVCFRFRPAGIDETQIDRINNILMEKLNGSGFLYLTHTKLNGRFTLRLVVAQTHVTKRHVEEAWEAVSSTARSLPVPS